MTDLPPGLFDLERRTVHGAEVLVYTNPVVENLRELLETASSHPPDRPYLVHNDEVITFGQLIPATSSLAAYLINECGLSEGARVAVSSANSIEWVLTAWATVATGRVIVGCNSWWHASETLNALQVCEPEILVVDKSRLVQLLPHLDELPSINRVLVTGDPGSVEHPLVAPFPEVSQTSEPIPAATIHTDDPATILFTSGTTGNAKGVIGTHRAATVTYQNIMHTGIEYFPTVALAPPSPGPPPPSSTVLSAPMFHVAGLQWGVMFPVGMGSTIILHTGRYDPDAVMDLVERHQCTSLGGVPTMMTRIVDSPSAQTRDLTSVTSVSWGGAPPPPDLGQRCLDTFPNLNLVGTGYGLTETCGLMLYAAGIDYINRQQIAGKTMRAAEVRICGPDDVPMKNGEEGEVQLRGAMVMPGYWQRSGASAEVLTTDGWLRTGDLGSLDADGFLTLTGRSKELIIRGGENIYPVEIEDVLTTHPDVLDAAVVGRPHPDLGEEVVAVVHVRDGSRVSGSELQTHVRNHLASFKVPVELSTQCTPLARNAAGKLLRDAISGGELRLTETL